MGAGKDRIAMTAQIALARAAPRRSMITGWRRNFLEALFAAGVPLALTMHRWRCAELVEPNLGQVLPKRFPARAMAASVMLLMAIVIGAMVLLAPANDEVVSVGPLPPALEEGLAERSAWGDDGGSDAGCAQCGVVESLREIVGDWPPGAAATGAERSGYPASQAAQATYEATPVPGFEITVRMRDGVSHLFRVARSGSTTNWWPGERVIYIDGRKLASD